MKNVLILESFRTHANDFIRAIKNKYRIFVDFYGRKTFQIYSKYVKPIKVPKEFLRKKEVFHNFVKKLKFVDVLVAIGPYAMENLSYFKYDLKGHFCFLAPDYDSFLKANSKPETYILCKESNVPVPEGGVAYSFEDIIKIARDLDSKKIVIKRAKGDVRKMLIIERNKINRYITLIKKYYTKEDFPLLVTEYIEGDGFGYYAICKEGREVCFFMHHRLIEYPLTGGASAIAESYFDEKLLEYGRKLVKKLKWEGPIMVEFKRDKRDNKHKVLEINAKFWGSLGLSIVSGLNIPEIYVKASLGEKIGKRKYKIRQRWFRGKLLLFEIFTDPRVLLHVIKYLGAKSLDNDLSDPLCTIWYYISALIYLIKNYKRESLVARGKHYLLPCQ